MYTVVDCKHSYLVRMSEMLWGKGFAVFDRIIGIFSGVPGSR